MRFDPGRAAPLRLTRELQQCLEQTRAALEDLQSEWQELVESPEGALSEIASVTADADGLRTLVAKRSSRCSHRCATSSRCSNRSSRRSTGC